MVAFCFDCEKAFSSQSTFNRHNRNVHQQMQHNYIGYTVPRRYMCLDCKLYYNFNNDLRLHLKDAHDHITESENLEFENISDFNAWLAEEEKQNNVQYCRVRGVNCINGSKRLYFECVKSCGYYSLKKDLKKAPKSQDLYKMPYSCTSQIIVKENTTGMCEVCYFKTHYGHNQDMRHLNLSQDKSDKTSIKARHKSALISAFTVSQDNDIFTLRNQKNHEYIVERKNNVNCCCIECPVCDICIHSYTCSCIDFLRGNTICKHIHFVALKYPEEQSEKSSECGDMSCEEQELLSHISQDSVGDNLKEQITTKLQSILQNISSKEMSKEQLTSIFHHITSALAVSNIPANKFTANNSETETELENRDVVKQKGFFCAVNQSKNINISKRTSKGKDNKTYIFCDDIIISLNPENDHQYV